MTPYRAFCADTRIVYLTKDEKLFCGIYTEFSFFGQVYELGNSDEIYPVEECHIDSDESYFTKKDFERYGYRILE